MHRFVAIAGAVEPEMENRCRRWVGDNDKVRDEDVFLLADLGQSGVGHFSSWTFPSVIHYSY